MATAANKPGRLLSLDIFRGMTIAFMIFVNSRAHEGGGNVGPFDHGGWGTATLTDWVFPFFIFFVGIGMPFSFARRLAEPGGKRTLYAQIVKRTLLLIVIGWFLHLTPFFKVRELRYLGVLPRIGICYFVTSLLMLNFGRRVQVAAVILLLGGYWAAMAWIPFPGKGGTWEKSTPTEARNLADYIDRHVLGVHMQRPYNNEDKGIISTFPAITTCLLGFMCGAWLRSKRPPLEITNGLFVWGSVLVGAGWFVHDWGVPYYQGLWTPSFALMMPGLSMLFQAALYWCYDIRGHTWGSRFFCVFGANPLLAYCGHQILDRCMSLTGKHGGPEAYIFFHWLQPWLGAWLGAAVYGLVMVALWWAVCDWLYRRRIVVKV